MSHTSLFISILILLGVISDPPVDLCSFELNWLPVEMRILFTLLCIIFKLIVSRHLRIELITAHTSNVDTKSCGAVKLVHLKVRPQPSKAYDDKAFRVYAPKTWNCLPIDLRCINEYNSFKSFKNSPF